MTIPVENLDPATLSPEQRNALALLVNTSPTDLAGLKHMLHLGAPSIVGPQTLAAFVALCAAHGMDLTDEGIQQFKTAHWLARGAEIGPTTAAAWVASLMTAMPAPVRGVGRVVNDAGVKLVQRFEGYESRAYQDQAGIWTIAWGHTPASPGQTVTPEKGRELLMGDLAWAEDAVNRLVTVPTTDNQYNALVSFTYNAGAAALASSSMLRDLNAGNVTQAADDFMRWNKITVNGQLVVCDGLTQRRAAERALFLS